jgi:WD40 repeat protein
MAGAGGSTGMAGAGGAGGKAGAGGSTGMAGAGGAGGTIQIVSPPSLTKCTEYLHINALSCTSTSTNANTLVWDVAFSPDGSLLATAGDDGIVKLWKMNGSVPTPEGHTFQTTLQAYVAFSPDGKWIAVGSAFGDYELYDAKTFQLKGTLTGHSDDIEGVAFTSDSASFWAVDLSGVLTRHDIGGGLAPGASVTTGATGFTLALSPVMSATVQWGAIGFDDGTGDIANIAPGMQTPTPITVSHDTYGVYGMSFSPDGTKLVAGGHDGIVGFWNIPPPANGASTGTTVTLPNSANKPEAVKAVRYSPDGKYVAIAAGDPTDQWKVAIYNVATKTQVTKIPTYTPLSIAWSPSGGIIAAGEDTCGKVLICSDN